MIIDDGTGSGRKAEVNKNNKLMVNAVAASPEHFINTKGQAYSVSFAATPAGPGDCFFYMKNTSDTDMIIEGFGLYLVANEYVDVNLKVEGIPIGGSDITPINLNGGSGNLADGDFENGNDITGLTGSVAYRFYHASGNDTKYHNFEMDIILTKNQTLMLCIQTGTTALAGFINIAYGE